VISKLLLIYQAKSTNSCVGLSLKTQIVYLIVFLTRYGFNILHFISVYNTAMKVFYIGSSLFMIYLMMSPLKASYDKEADSFVTWPLFPISLILAVIFFNHERSWFTEILWTFSIILEAAAIMPQLFMSFNHCGLQGIFSS
jgi:ER lumen protein retaining receptor